MFLLCTRDIAVCARSSQVLQRCVQDHVAADGLDLAWEARVHGADHRLHTGREGREGLADGPAPGRVAESRFCDGLLVPDRDAAQGPFYAPGYRCDVGTLPFCLDLPNNPLGLPFEPPALAELCADAVVKVQEVRRQRLPLGPQHVVALYVYTYELAGEGEQIYSAMNRAMRLRDAAAVDFWRPLIWQVGGSGLC